MLLKKFYCAMGQAHSSHHQQQMNWLEFCKLTFVTVALGAVQFARYRLASADEDERRAARQRGWSHQGRQQTEHNHQSVFHALPHDVRRSLVTFIDTSITPLLIDQWRCGSKANNLFVLDSTSTYTADGGSSSVSFAGPVTVVTCSAVPR